MASLFTKIINHEIPADIVHEDDVCIAFRDIEPKAPVHLLIVPRKEIRSLADLEPGDEKILGHLQVVAGRLAEKMGFAKSGFRLVVNVNEDGGQTIYHLHLHILAGRTLSWPPG